MYESLCILLLESQEKKTTRKRIIVFAVKEAQEESIHVNEVQHVCIGEERDDLGVVVQVGHSLTYVPPLLLVVSLTTAVEVSRHHVLLSRIVDNLLSLYC